MKGRPTSLGLRHFYDSKEWERHNRIISLDIFL